MDVLRFITAGSVDDGKSTLIGRLLFDSHAVSTDIIEAIERQTKKTGKESIDLSFLTDGLRAEREQNITIDVAYKYFTTAKRKFIIADTPGHAEFTRNMVTGASTANLAIILIDVRRGITEQTRRHTFIASLLRIPEIVVCVNKMDLVDYAQEKFEEIAGAYSRLTAGSGLNKITFIPVSAAHGDNVVKNLGRMNWYGGKNLLQHLEEVEVDKGILSNAARFQVQYIIRQSRDNLDDNKGYAGKVACGTFKKGDKIIIFPEGIENEISEIQINLKPAEKVIAQQPVVFHLKNNAAIRRGSMFVKKDLLPLFADEMEATICWMSEKPMETGGQYILQHYSNSVITTIKNITEKININSFAFERSHAEKAMMNDIVRVSMKTSEPIPYDLFSSNRYTGGFILIDEQTNNTVGAGFF